jgi:hypothetical protein
MQLVLSFNVQIKLPIWHPFNVFLVYFKFEAALAIKPLHWIMHMYKMKTAINFSRIYRHKQQQNSGSYEK